MNRNFTRGELVLVAVILGFGFCMTGSVIHAGQKSIAYGCLDNLRRIGNGITMYAAANNDHCPTLNAGNWTNQAMWYGMIAQYAGIAVSNETTVNQALTCPDDVTGKKLSPGTASYGYNNGYFDGQLASRGGTWGKGTKLSMVKFPASTLLAGDRGTAAADELRPGGEISYSAKDGTRPGDRHDGGASCVFPDGHAEVIAAKTLLYITDPWQKPGNRYFGYGFAVED